MSKNTNKPSLQQDVLGKDMGSGKKILSKPMKKASPTAVESEKVTHEQIAERAYQIYMEKGCPSEQSEQIWKQAEKEMLKKVSQMSK